MRRWSGESSPFEYITVDPDESPQGVMIRDTRGLRVAAQLPANDRRRTEPGRMRQDGIGTSEVPQRLQPCPTLRVRLSFAFRSSFSAG